MRLPWGILAHAPFVIEHAQITVTDTAIADVDFDLIMVQGIGEIVLERLKASPGLSGGVGIYRWHGLSRVAVG
jgi:hypothetical protein